MISTMIQHRFHRTLLREYDIRGIVNETLFPADAYALGRCLAVLAEEQKAGTTAVVGRDGRLSSPALEAELIRGLVEGGLSVIRIGLGPTPMLYWAQKKFEAAVAVIVTGSHNPPDHNGFKMMLGGKPLYGKMITHLGEIATTLPESKTTVGKGQISDRPVLDQYVAALSAGWDGGATELTVVWDTGNGAAGEAMSRLIAQLPGRHIPLYADIDGNFPNHHPDPTLPETLHDLIETVRREKADVGLAFDGDGDRLGVVDAQGRILWGDQILQILAEDVLKSHPGATIIADVKSSQTLFDEIKRLGGCPLMWKTGHSLIKTKMAETGAPLAGEMSGHLFFADRWGGFDDGLYAAVRFLGVVARMKEGLAQRVDRLPATYNTPELRFPCADDRKFAVIHQVRSSLEGDGADICDIDGIRVRRDDGWWLLRASNTQAVLVARVEANSPQRLNDLRRELERIMKDVDITIH
ncbi:phosphoglucomutase/phosphomannomutase PgmG [Dongia soli]|uniref:Phosphomannomutase/phosphoglucomutase n=1 Tax=Dongia soli TaxID=600628 RepID=A0ABU5EDF9_9PROT|nr:phosphomannomutase/phosphoglucomutase [Dongia soli]MDY0884258.1 phosphomannomutase/phosphoglucomutase [Dongia soli]